MIDRIIIRIIIFHNFQIKFSVVATKIIMFVRWLVSYKGRDKACSRGSAKEILVTRGKKKQTRKQPTFSDKFTKQKKKSKFYGHL